MQRKIMAPLHFVNGTTQGEKRLHAFLYCTSQGSTHMALSHFSFDKNGIYLQSRINGETATSISVGWRGDRYIYKNCALLLTDNVTTGKTSKNLSELDKFTK